MNGSREYPGAFAEIIDSPPSERQRRFRVYSNEDGRNRIISLDDFYAHMPTHRYIFVPCRQLWPARSVNARLGFIDGIRASDWFDQNRHVEQMTWAPGQPMLINDRLISEGGGSRSPVVEYSTCIALQISGSAIRKPLSHGSTIFTASILMTSGISSDG
jgi:hypothetical protein